MSRPHSREFFRFSGLCLYLISAQTLVGCDGERNLPDQHQSAERIQLIRKLDLQRSGHVQFQVHHLDYKPVLGKSTQTRVRYTLYNPLSATEDTDIRGYLDGKTKYPYNQGTAYHMRVGRRIGGASKGELELKRTLVRWNLSPIPKEVRVVKASIRVWIEGFSTNSPLSSDRYSVNKKHLLPLHLYVYPLSPKWGPGKGGINQNSFSKAAPGEASWDEAQSGIRKWPFPGALQPGSDQPIGVGLINGDDKQLTITGERLLRYLEQCISAGRSFDVLLKLDDQEEDRWGTEVALLASEFGDSKDILSKRPRLDIEVELPFQEKIIDADFVLEPGEELILPVVKHPGRRVLLSASVSGDGDSTHVLPSIWVKGGNVGNAPSNQWVRLQVPLSKTWDWSQIKLLATPSRIRLGEMFSIELLETWVSPGPRESQLPEIVLIAPSGTLIRKSIETVKNHYYQFQFKPDELGLWRYGWSFLPRIKSPLGSHQGEGLFYVATPTGDSEKRELEAFAKRLIDSFKGKKTTGPAEQNRLNTFIRWASVYSHRGKEQNNLSEHLIDQVRKALPPSFRRPQHLK